MLWTPALPRSRGLRGLNIREIYGLVPGRSHCGFKPGELRPLTGIFFVLERAVRVRMSGLEEHVELHPS